MTVTTLAAAMDANGLSMQVASVAGATVGGFAKIDNEWTKITQIVAPIIFVRERGGEGGTALPHDVNAAVTFGIGTEMPAPGAGEIVPAPTEDRTLISVGSDQTIPWNSLRRDSIVTITKTGTAAALVLEPPPATADGIQLTIVSATALAHIVTATGLIDDGVTGGAKGTATFAAFVGASIGLVSSRGHWAVLSLKGVAVT